MQERSGKVCERFALIAKYFYYYFDFMLNIENLFFINTDQNNTFLCYLIWCDFMF